MENITETFELNDLIIAGSNSTFFVPEIHFIAATGQCSISGESYLEDTFNFYHDLKNWVEDYFASEKSKLVLDIKLSYFNTSSSRAILDLLKKLKEYEELNLEST